MEKTLWVKGCNGLGNRLLVLEKTLRLAAKYSSAVYIDWTDDVFSLSSSTFRKYFNLIQINEVEGLTIPTIELRIQNIERFRDIKCVRNRYVSTVLHFIQIASAFGEGYHD